MLIGVPRALLYYKYIDAWETFFKTIGQEILISPPTTKKILKLGTEVAENEICMPVKVFYGHVMYLKDKVDALFIPRIVSVEKKAFTCPKFLGLPDMIKADDGLPPVISPTINYKLGRMQYYKTIYELGRQFTNNNLKIMQAYLNALKVQTRNTRISAKKEKEFVELIKDKIKGKNLKIGIAGHPYNIHDEFISMHLVKRLKQKGVELITAESTNPANIKNGAKILDKDLFWTYEKEVIGAASHWLQKKLVDGIIYIIAFPCGPDSILQVILENISKKLGKVPLMSLVLDEHSGEAGLITRVEAFIDQLKYRKAAQSG